MLAWFCIQFENLVPFVTDSRTGCMQQQQVMLELVRIASTISLILGMRGPCTSFLQNKTEEAAGSLDEQPAFLSYCIVKSLKLLQCGCSAFWFPEYRIFIVYE